CARNPPVPVQQPFRPDCNFFFFIPARYPVNLSSALPLTVGKPCLVFNTVAFITPYNKKKNQPNKTP
ncbi:hypothetical protein ACVGW4_01440, partial [Enterobacter hormaechei]